MKDRRLVKRTIDSIKIGNRHRKDLGDIAELAISISQIGLINPITITSEGLLIAGHRRLEACKHLGWRLIQCVIADDIESAIARLTAEQDENTKRKEMTPAERASLGLAIEALEKPKARARQAASAILTNAKLGRGSQSKDLDDTVTVTGRESSLPAQKRYVKETDSIVGRVVGWSGTTYSRAKAVVNAARDESLTEQQKAVVKAALADMEETGNVSGNFNKVKEAIRPTPTITKKSTSMLAKEQRYAFDKNLPQMSGMMLLFERIDSLDPEITDDEIEKWISSLSKTRRSIEQIIKRLKDMKKNA